MRIERWIASIGMGLSLLLFTACAGPGLLQAATDIPGGQTPPITQSPTQPQPSPSLTTAAPTANVAPPELNATSTAQVLTAAQAELELQSLMPQPGDAALSRGIATLERPAVTRSTDLSPVALVTLKGWLPTPCHHLRIQLAGPDASNLVTIQAYSVFDPQAICPQIVALFAVTLPIHVLNNGSYSLEINGKIIRGFDWPLR